MANGRDYGSFDYGIGVYGTALVVDATCTISATSNATANGSRTRTVSEQIVATSNASATPTRIISSTLNVISVSSSGAAAADTEIAYCVIPATSTASAVATRV